MAVVVPTTIDCLLQWIFVVLSALVNLTSAVSNTVSATVPVNPVETNGILSLSCKVWNLDSNIHTIQIFRRTTASGRSEQLSVDGDVLQRVDDRVFLAFRQLDDQSAIYFLSITDITKDDQGIYSCKIITKEGSIREVASDVVNISVTYFPSESDPVCSSFENINVMEGTTLTFNCSSEIANPPVSLHWRQTKEQDLTKGTENYVSNQRLVSSLSFKASMGDNGVMFLCVVTSVAFPDDSRSCHIGPLNVKPNSNLPRDDGDDDTQLFPISTPGIVPSQSTDTTDDNKIKRTLNTRTCSKTCSYFTYPLLHWIVATAVALILTVIFLICILLVYGKYRQVRKQSKEKLHGPPRLPEGIYSELECKQGEPKMYMTLVDSNASSNQVDLPGKKIVAGGYYGAMPRAPQQYW